MAGALVGTIGTVVTAAAGSGVSPAWGAGESRAAGNLLILWVAGCNSTSFPPTPAGWTIANRAAGTAGSATGTIFYTNAVGGDAAPTVGAPTGGGTTLFAQLAEFSGLAATSPVDQATGNAGGTTSPLTATNAAADASSGELLIGIGAALYTATTGTKTMVLTSNNATLTSSTNQGGTIINEYDFAYGFTTANASADTMVNTYSTTRITGAMVCEASFKLFVQPPAPPIRRMNQAVNRAATFFTRVPWHRQPSGLLAPSRKLILA